MPAGSDPPDGFHYQPRAPFINHVGPIYQAISDEAGVVRLGLRVEQTHANTLGLMHGGMIATLADSAMARALNSHLKRRSVTLKMTLEYLEAVQVGDWLEAEGRLTAHDAEIGLTSCALRAGGALKAAATGVFRLLRAD